MIFLKKSSLNSAKLLDMNTAKLVAAGVQLGTAQLDRSELAASKKALRVKRIIVASLNLILLIFDNGSDIYVGIDLYNR